jgi:hypothetical protein
MSFGGLGLHGFLVVGREDVQVDRRRLGAGIAMWNTALADASGRLIANDPGRWNIGSNTKELAITPVSSWPPIDFFWISVPLWLCEILTAYLLSPRHGVTERDWLASLRGTGVPPVILLGSLFH